MQQFMVVAHRLDQPRTVGVFVDAKQHVAFFPRAVEDFSQNRVVTGEDAALKIALLPREITHPACRPGCGKTCGKTCCDKTCCDKTCCDKTCGKTWAAISRVRLTSTISSSSGGMLSSRSIMVETRPKRFKAAT